MNAWDWFIGPWRVFIFVSVQAVIAVTNALLMRRPGAFPRVAARPKVSVLVPARDEEATVGACVRSLLEQSYADCEVVVLDDHSTDRTAEIVGGLHHPHLRMITGKALPEGWTGKAWACAQLAEAATGELLLFTDADTVFEPNAVESAVRAQAASGAEVISGITRNDVLTAGEQLTVPFLVWSIVTLLPLGLAYRLRRWTALSAANGKFMLFRRSAYERIGGYAAVRDDAAEDLAICRLVKRAGLCWRMLDLSRVVRSRMYSGLRDAVAGFSKNYFALFGYRVLPALFVWFWLMLITWYPVVTIVVSIRAHHLGGAFIAACLTIGVAAGQWLLVALKFGMPARLFLFYPLIITMSAFIGLRAMAHSIAGIAEWKGRVLVRRKPRVV